MRLFFINLGLIVFSTAFIACGGQPVVPEAKNVKVSRDNPRTDCREIGRVQGSVATHVGSIDQAIEDMRLDAARRGANFIRMEATGVMGTSVAGTAYQCP